MKFSQTLAVLFAASAVTAHHVITHFAVDDVRQNNVLRQPGTVSPITDLNSPDLACGYPPSNGQGMKGTEKAVIQPGSKLTFEWHINWSGSVSGPEGVTDDSHKGPCAIYMRKVRDAVSADAIDRNKSGWFKIMEDGVDGSGKFCTTRMRENGGFFSSIVPKHLANGDYLIRAETLTLNNAAEPHREPQWYVGCAQVTMENSEPPFIEPPSINIPSGDYANGNMPGLRYNIWYPIRDDYSDYLFVPGPRPYNDGSDAFQIDDPNLSGGEETVGGGFGDIGTPFISLTTASTTPSSMVITSHHSVPTGVPASSSASRSHKSRSSTTTTSTETVRPTIRTTSTVIVTLKSTRPSTSVLSSLIAVSPVVTLPTITPKVSTRTIIHTAYHTHTIYSTRTYTLPHGFLYSHPHTTFHRSASHIPKIKTLTRVISVVDTVVATPSVTIATRVGQLAEEAATVTGTSVSKYYRWHRSHLGLRRRRRIW